MLFLAAVLAIATSGGASSQGGKLFHATWLDESSNCAAIALSPNGTVYFVDYTSESILAVQNGKVERYALTKPGSELRVRYPQDFAFAGEATYFWGAVVDAQKEVMKYAVFELAQPHGVVEIGEAASQVRRELVAWNWSPARRLGPGKHLLFQNKWVRIKWPDEPHVDEDHMWPPGLEVGWFNRQGYGCGTYFFVSKVGKVGNRAIPLKWLSDGSFEKIPIPRPYTEGIANAIDDRGRICGAVSKRDVLRTFHALPNDHYNPPDELDPVWWDNRGAHLLPPFEFPNDEPEARACVAHGFLANGWIIGGQEAYMGSTGLDKDVVKRMVVVWVNGRPKPIEAMTQGLKGRRPVGIRAFAGGRYVLCYLDGELNEVGQAPLVLLELR